MNENQCLVLLAMHKTNAIIRSKIVAGTHISAAEGLGSKKEQRFGHFPITLYAHKRLQIRYFKLLHKD